MNEELIRTLVRESIARHMAPPHSGAGDRPDAQRDAGAPLAGHVSHYRYLLVGSGGPCLIEPTVQCNHCGYCESHGH